ncbi:hypothetical protein [Inhella sp.]|uniref:hypothetical protein n=1 Tax=Inhella sp. TaxID=1921806 RepID=UPI0035AF3A5E
MSFRSLGLWLLLVGAVATVVAFIMNPHGERSESVRPVINSIGGDHSKKVDERGAEPIDPSSAAKKVEEVDAVARLPLAVPKKPYKLSPGAQSLGDTIQLSLHRKDATLAFRTANALQTCLKLAMMRDAIDLLRSHPVREPGVNDKLVAEQNEQLAKSTAECQTVSGDPAALLRQLLQLAVDAGVPGAAAAAIEHSNVEPSSELFERALKDARNGELVSLANAVLDHRYKLSSDERTEMVLALLGAYQKARAELNIDNDITLWFGRVANHYWDKKYPPIDGTNFHLRKSLLPPDLAMPTDPVAVARVNRLTELLNKQVVTLGQERELARKAVAGG